MSDASEQATETAAGQNNPPTTGQPTEPATDNTTEAPSDLSGLKKALDAERKARREADKRNKELSAYEKQVKDAEEANKSELQKLQDALAAEKAARTTAELTNLRNEVGLAKAVPAGLIKFLSGSTKEELEAAADELLAQLEPAGPRVPGKPQSRLSDGRPSNSSLDGEDPLALIAMGRGEQAPK
jgi:hypothetical protein